MSDRTIVPTWPIPTEDWEPALTVGEIQVWLADLGRPPKPLAELAAVLSVDERERAERFRFPEHRDRFVAHRHPVRGRGCRRSDLVIAIHRHHFRTWDHACPTLCS